MKNQSGVQLYVATTASKGLDVALWRSGADMKIKK